jgi:NAD(P)-dependent dehydrogenase (short-subunit alcohol dehydrogenase family)
MANWFITGISRGFGRIMAEELLARGHTVVGTTRDGRAPMLHDRLTVFRLDVRDADQADAVLAEAVATTGGIDVLVNNAGYGLVGAVEEVSAAEAEAVIGTNLIGTHNVIRAALPAMRAQGRGHIVNFSSVGALPARSVSGSTMRPNSRSRACPRLWRSNWRPSASASPLWSRAISAPNSSPPTAPFRPSPPSTPMPRAQA